MLSIALPPPKSHVVSLKRDVVRTLFTNAIERRLPKKHVPQNNVAISNFINSTLDIVEDIRHYSHAFQNNRVKNRTYTLPCDSSMMELYNDMTQLEDITYFTSKDKCSVYKDTGNSIPPLLFCIVEMLWKKNMDCVCFENDPVCHYTLFNRILLQQTSDGNVVSTMSREFRLFHNPLKKSRISSEDMVSYIRNYITQNEVPKTISKCITLLNDHYLNLPYNYRQAIIPRFRTNQQRSRDKKRALESQRSTMDNEPSPSISSTSSSFPSSPIRSFPPQSMLSPPILTTLSRSKRRRLDTYDDDDDDTSTINVSNADASLKEVSPFPKSLGSPSLPDGSPNHHSGTTVTMETVESVVDALHIQYTATTIPKLIREYHRLNERMIRLFTKVSYDGHIRASNVENARNSGETKGGSRVYKKPNGTFGYEIINTLYYTMSWSVFFIYALLCLMIVGIVWSTRDPNAQVEERRFPLSVNFRPLDRRTDRVLSLRVWVSQEATEQQIDRFFESVRSYNPPSHHKLQVHVVYNDLHDLSYMVQYRLSEWEKQYRFHRHALIHQYHHLDWEWKQSQPDVFMKTLSKLHISSPFSMRNGYIAWVSLDSGFTSWLSTSLKELEDNTVDVVHEKRFGVVLSHRSMKHVEHSDEEHLKSLRVSFH